LTIRLRLAVLVAAAILAVASLCHPRDARAADDVTVTRLLGAFDALVFWDDGRTLVETRKWRTPLRVQLDGAPSAEEVRMTMAAIATAAQAAGLAMERVAADGNFVVRFERDASYVVNGRRAGCYATTGATSRGEIREARLFIDRAQRDLRRCIAHEVMHGFGFPGHPEGIDSILAVGPSQRRDSFAEADLVALATLYDDRMRAGATYLPGLLSARQIIAERVGAVAPGAAADHLARGHLAQAVSRLHARAEGGDAPAQRLLGIAHYMAQAVPRDDAAAVAWWRAAAARRDTAATFWLGEAALAGRGGPVDPVTAQAQHAMAAARGHVAAMVRTAQALDQGRGVARDPLAAAVWYLAAAQRGNALATSEAPRALARLAPPERALAEERARSWRPAP
jgi:hypothetical protein